MEASILGILGNLRTRKNAQNQIWKTRSLGLKRSDKNTFTLIFFSFMFLGSCKKIMVEVQQERDRPLLQRIEEHSLQASMTDYIVCSTALLTSRA